MTLYRLGDRAPRVPENGDFWVAPGAHVIGDVTIGAGVGIWFGVTIRGDNDPVVIGAGSNVQENCVFHTDEGYPLTVGRNVTVGHKAMLHGCTVGDNSLIGMGAVVLNGAVIGKNCLVGAGALVTENKVIADGSLVVGSPAVVKRSLDEKAIAALAWSAEHYQANMRRFREGLQPV